MAISVAHEKSRTVVSCVRSIALSETEEAGFLRDEACGQSVGWDRCCGGFR